MYHLNPVHKKWNRHMFKKVKKGFHNLRGCGFAFFKKMLKIMPKIMLAYSRGPAQYH